MLKKIYVDNFRQLKNFSIGMKEQNTLLCGVNGTGKSTILKILHSLQRFIVLGVEVSTVCDRNDIPRWEHKDYGVYISNFKLDFVIESHKYTYELTISIGLKNGSCRVMEESLIFDGNNILTTKEGDTTIITDDGKTVGFPTDWTLTTLQLASRTQSKIRTFLEYIEKNLFVLSIEPCRDTPNINAEVDSQRLLLLNTKNFSSWYGYILGENLSAIASSFKYIEPFIKGFKQFSYINTQKDSLYVDMQHDSKPYRLSFYELSDGQQALCILYTVLQAAPENSIICIDEFENYLSPIELQPLYNLIQDIYEEKNIQCIIISHNAKTMNWFASSAVILSHSYDNLFIKSTPFEEKEISIDEYLYNTSGN